MTTTTDERRSQDLQAQGRAENGQSMSNYPAIFDGFAAKGIDDIRPRENIFTYRVWKLKNRQVRRGEKGVKVLTRIPMTIKDKETGEKKSIGTKPKTATVFHVTQTDPIG